MRRRSRTFLLSGIPLACSGGRATRLSFIRPRGRTHSSGDAANPTAAVPADETRREDSRARHRDVARPPEAPTFALPATLRPLVTASPDLKSRPTSEGARAGLVLALHAVARAERNALDGLRDALCPFVAALRREGLSKVDALLAVREVLTTVSAPDGELALLPAAREALLELSTHWCGEE